MRGFGTLSRRRPSGASGPLSPVGARAFADFVNGVYWNGGAPTTPDALFESDTVDGDLFNSAEIVPGTGYVNAVQAGGKFKGAAALSSAPNFTAVIEWSSPTGKPNTNVGIFAYDYASYAAWWGCYSKKSDHAGEGHIADQDALAFFTGNGSGDGTHRLALTFNGPASTASMSLDGGTVATGSLGRGADVWAALSWSQDSGAITRSVAIYEPVADSQLPALSAP